MAQGQKGVWQDDVTEVIKKRRLKEIVNTYREIAYDKSKKKDKLCPTTAVHRSHLRYITNLIEIHYQVFETPLSITQSNMGVGSTTRQKYYVVLGIIYLFVGIMPIILFPMTADCPPLCALRFPDRPWKSWECTESIGQPMTNYGDMEEYKRIYLQFYVNTTGPCYVCQASNATTLLEPCKPCPAAKMSEGGVPWESNDPRYSTLSSCATPGSMSECAKAEIPNYKIAVTAKANDKFCLGDQSCSLDSDNPLAFRTPFAPTPDINFRGIQPLIMLGIGVLYLGQAIGCLATACCLQSFKECVCG